MAIVLVRIDDRLIHGQVVEGWLKAIRVNHIAVISDEVAADKMQQVLLGMAVPHNVKVTVMGVEEAAARVASGQFDAERLLVLVSRPADLVRLLDGGVKIDSVNVGGMHYGPGKRQLLRNLSVDNDDIAALKNIAGRHIELEGRVLPQDDRINVADVIDRELQRGM